MRGIEPRIYQQTIFAEVVDKNALVVLPTGLGKTIVIAYLTAYRLGKNPEQKVVVTTPTKPLVHQTAAMLRDYLTIESSSIIEITGELSPSKRIGIYPSAQVIVTTPQTLENDLLNDRIDPRSFSLTCFDEAHRATGDYAYTRIVEDLPRTCQIVGFTATPGNTVEAIREVLGNLHSMKIVSRDYDSPDVKQYASIHRPKVVWVDLPEDYGDVLRLLREEVRKISKTLEEAGLDIPRDYVGKKDALTLQQQVLKLRKSDPRWGAFLVSTANLIRLLHLLDLAESQGFPQALDALNKWTNKRRTKALDVFLESYGIKKTFSLIQANPVPHPKLERLVEILSKAIEDSDSRTIVFSNFRSTVKELQNALSIEYNIPCTKFVGQSASGSLKGMTQREQVEALEAFKKGDPPVLISTSVGEEGLDVGSCDLVIFYDSVPSVIRSVQRTGRGRKRESRVVRLITKGTRDEAIHYATLNRQRRLREALFNIDALLIKNTDEQGSLEKFLQHDKGKEIEVRDQAKEEPVNDVVVLIDNREARSIVPRALKRQQGIRFETCNLPSGDYAVSDRTCIERKTTTDFVESLVSPIGESVGENRLFNEIRRLSEAYDRPIVIVEGNWDQARSISEESIQGAIVAIIVGFRVPILFSNNAIETAQLIARIARREQKARKRPSLSAQTSGMSDAQIRETLLTTVPGINLTRARTLLKTFGTIRKIANSNENDLQEAPGVGQEIARRLSRIFSNPSDKENRELS